MSEPHTPESIQEAFERLADPLGSGRQSQMATHMPISWYKQKGARDDAVATAIGMVLVSILLGSLALVAAGGWTWFVSFLSGPASSWAQAIGGVLAVFAAFQVGRAQIVADRELDRARQLDEDIRSIAVIEAGLAYIAHAMFLFQIAASESFPHVPQGTANSLQEGAGLLRRLDPFKCPTAQLAHTITYIPALCDEFISRTEQYWEGSEGIPDSEFVARRVALWKTGKLLIESTEGSRKMCAVLRDALEKNRT